MYFLKLAFQTYENSQKGQRGKKFICSNLVTPFKNSEVNDIQKCKGYTSKLTLKLVIQFAGQIILSL